MINLLQVISAVALIVLILLQERSAGLSGLLGGGEVHGGFYQTRRGLEKLVFNATIVVAVIFAGLSIIQLLG